ncbi:DUF2243 domain-containing protein [Cereibacter sphaeroides]|nr:DUF2243 domain-containing protein [Cereibacter sphaeroides]
MRRPRRACAAGRSGRAARAFGNGTARLRFLRDASPGVAIDRPRFPPGAGILPGLGGFFDGIVPHRILQWHHMATSAGYPPHSVENLQLNTQLDRLFHTATYLCLLGGLVLLWRAARRPHALWPAPSPARSSWGSASSASAKGVASHQVLGITV